MQGAATQKIERTEIRAIIMNNDFVKNVKKSFAILKSIDLLNVKYQSDRVPISEVMPDFPDFPAGFEKFYCSGIISNLKEDYLI